MADDKRELAKTNKNIFVITYEGLRSKKLNEKIREFAESLGLKCDYENDVFYIQAHQVMRFNYTIPKSKQIEFRDKE